MADDTAPEIPPDPIYTRSLGFPILLAMLAVLASVALAIVDEMVWRRPYKAIQSRYKERVAEHLDSLLEQREVLANALKDGGRYGELNQAITDAEADIADEKQALGIEISNVGKRLRAMNEALKSPNSLIAALNYKAEHAAAGEGTHDVQGSSAAASYLKEIEKVRDETISFTWDKTVAMEAAPSEDEDEDEGDGDEPEPAPPVAKTEPEVETGTVRDFVAEAQKLQVDRAALQTKLGEVGAEVAKRRKERDTWYTSALGDVQAALDALDEFDEERANEMRVRLAAGAGSKGAAAVLSELVTLDVAQINSLQAANDKLWSGAMVYLIGNDMQQIHVAEANNWVDRCETCHMGTRYPLPLTEEDMGERLFISHPRKELLDTHDPERFGCSTCHNGNGVAITSEKLAHGLNKYWLHPLYRAENIEAGCVQCHQDDWVLPMGDRISTGRELFRHRGCWGCHPRGPYDVEENGIRAARNEIQTIDETIAAKELEARNLRAILDPLADADDAEFLRRQPEVKRKGDQLAMEIAGLETERQVMAQRLTDYSNDKKRVGPNLKDVRLKVRREWLTDWVKNGRHFRPDTRMPQFRWEDDDETKAVAAFLWQRAFSPDEVKLSKQPKGDTARGQELFESLTCQSCHSMGEGDERVGNDFAANLSRVGSKANYDYLVRWVWNPRRRLVPFDIEAGVDVVARAEGDLRTDEQIAGDADPSNLLWRSTSIMPNLRTNPQEARDLATYLLGQTGDWEPTFDAGAAWLDDADLVAKGERLVRHLGCAGCHEIRGLEGEQRIGTQLNDWGSKPKERLDFGHYTLDAKRGNEPMAEFETPHDGLTIFEDDAKWYTHRGFVMHKLAKPDFWDDGKNIENRFGKLRMPNFGFSGQQIHDLTTYVLGSVKSEIPESFRYNPDARGKAIQDGWKVVRKYNCAGCHQIQPGDVPFLQSLPDFQKDQKHFNDLPPSLVGTGFRTDPAWLAKFLRDPSLGGHRRKPRSVRNHLSVRMPTFSFTENEIRVLVRFFDALSNQPPVYQKPALDPLTPTEHKLARGIYAKANCLQCHIVGNEKVNSETKAPKFDYSKERLRPEFMHRWIGNPPLMDPNTQMTKLFIEQPDGRWTYDAEDQVPGLKAYEGDHISLMIRFLQYGDLTRPKAD